MNALNSSVSTAFFKTAWLPRSVDGFRNFAGLKRVSQILGSALLILMGSGLSAKAQVRTDPFSKGCLAVGTDAYRALGAAALTNCMKFATISGRRAESGDLFSELDGAARSQVIHRGVRELKAVRLHRSETVPVVSDYGFRMFVC